MGKDSDNAPNVKREVVSRQWSLSELMEGQKSLMQVKTESPGEEALKKQIEDGCIKNVCGELTAGL